MYGQSYGGHSFIISTETWIFFLSKLYLWWLQFSITHLGDIFLATTGQCCKQSFLSCIKVAIRGKVGSGLSLEGRGVSSFDHAADNTPSDVMLYQSQSRVLSRDKDKPRDYSRGITKTFEESRNIFRGFFLPRNSQILVSKFDQQQIDK